MARELNRLRKVELDGAQKPGRLSDGGGLFFLVGAGKARSWAFVSRKHGKWRELGLGSYPEISLATARRRATQLREQIANGQDPFEKKERGQTFGEFADKHVEAIASGFRNAKHLQQWQNTLSDAYCASLRNIPIDEVGTDDVLAVLRPIWTKTPETADRLRSRIEAVLHAANARGLRSGDNPATGRGHINVLLPRRDKRSDRHHASMAWKDVPAFWQKLARLESTSADALRFLILTAARSGEVMGATWAEIEGDIWRIPAERMKAGEEHLVPLSDPALAILDKARARKPAPGGYVFPGAKPGSQLSVMAMAMCLRGLEPSGVTVHGFRSSFRTWVAEATDFPREIAENALAHVVGSKVERAYLRTKFFEKRKELMPLWAGFVTGGRDA